MEEHMKKIAQPVLLVAGAVLVLTIWRSPATAASDVTIALGNIGTFLQEVVSRVADFLASFGGE
jgi:hypothetical protein